MNSLIFLLLLSFTSAPERIGISFTDCVAIGYITSDIQKRYFPLSLNETYTNQPDYYNFTRDTSFQTFPIDYSPQCIPEKYLIWIYHTDILTEIIIIQLIYLIIISPTLCICYCSDKKERKELCGVYVGTFIRNMLDDY